MKHTQECSFYEEMYNMTLNYQINNETMRRKYWLYWDSWQIQRKIASEPN